MTDDSTRQAFQALAHSVGINTISLERCECCQNFNVYDVNDTDEEGKISPWFTIEPYELEDGKEKKPGFIAFENCEDEPNFIWEAETIWACAVQIIVYLVEARAECIADEITHSLN
jgi:hypothetical protein